MAQTFPAGGSASAAPKGLIGRVFGVVFSPAATYAEVAARPRALGVLLLTLLVLAASSVIFFSTEVGQTALLDQNVKTLESFGMKVTDQVYQQLEDRLSQPRTPYLTAASQVVAVPIIAVVFTGIVLVIFNAILGGNATFKQTFAVIAHAGVITALQPLFTFPLDYVRESLSSPTSLAVFFPFLDESSFAQRFLGSIDLFLLWWIVNLSIGLGILYKRRTRPIVAGLLLTYVAIALVLAGVRAALSGA